ncbi:MAG: hypothetical protein EOM91_17980 [Sphingobacteriia bacterium]|nr:hypothetical protein [Sphingobacteriia bacterium]
MTNQSELSRLLTAATRLDELSRLLANQAGRLILHHETPAWELELWRGIAELRAELERMNATSTSAKDDEEPST